MKALKVLLFTAAICSALLAVLLLWNEAETTCGELTCKVVETMFIITSIVTTKEGCSINIK